MLLDWFTIAAQIINFLILVWLLKHFLYGPILRAMNMREEKITSRLKDASQSREEAEETKEDFRRKTEKLEAEKQAILKQVKAEAEEERRRTLDNIRLEAENMRRNWQRNLAEQQESFLKELRRRTVAGILSIARRTLHDLADLSLEEKMADLFLQYLRNMADEDLQELRQAVSDQDQAVTVVSVFELPAAARNRMTKGVRGLLGRGINVQYEQDADLLVGFKLKGANNIVGWNMAEYLTEFEKEIGQTISRESSRQGEVEHGT